MRSQAIGNWGLRARIPAAFAAVLEALQLPGEDPQTLRSLSDSQWRKLLPMMDRARLTLPLAVKGNLDLPGWVRDRLRSNLADTAQHSECVHAAYREADAVLAANGVEYLILKGFAQAPEFVSKPQLRRQGDIDLYVPRKDISIAVRALQGIGYHTCQPEEDYRYADHVPTLVRFGTWKWRGNIYDPEVPPPIELHFCMWNDSVYSIPVPEMEQFWDRRKFRKVDGLSFPALHPVDHVGYFALHILRNALSGESPVHHVLELATFLDKHSSDSAFWSEWAAMHSPRLRGMQAIAFCLAIGWFSCRAHHAVKAEINSLRPQIRAWIETCGCAPLEAVFHRRRDGRLLQLSLVDDPEARRRIMWKALAPGRVSGPGTHALRTTHPLTRDPLNQLITYLRYPAYLTSRAWMNGCAIIRFLGLACLLYARRVRVHPARVQNKAGVPGD